MNQRFREQIKHLGLTEKETETYLAILKKGPTTAAEVAECTDVSKRHVYNIAQKLEEREFVIINDYVTPTVIEPTQPSSVYERLQEEAEEVFRELESQYESVSQDTADIKVLKSRVTVLNKIEDLIASASDRVAISIPADFVPKLREPLQAAVDDGVTVLLVLFENPISEQQSPDISLEGVGNVIRYRDNEIPVLLAVDRERGLVSQRGVIAKPNSQINALFFSVSYLESVVYSSLMNASWPLAEEIHTEPPEALPHRYVNIRGAAADAALHRRDGTGLTATVEAKPSRETGKITELSGEVVDIKQRLVEPTSNARPGQCCFHLDTGSEVITVGGRDAYMEDYSAYSVTLDTAE